MSNSRSTTVECYSGYTYAQEPRAFSQGTEHHAITEIRRQWREPAGPRFEVLADDGATYLLAYDETTDHWDVSTQGHYTFKGNFGPTTTLKMEEDGQR
jgi:hypothetical protein